MSADTVVPIRAPDPRRAARNRRRIQRYERVRAALRRAAPALALYAAARLTGMSLMAAWAWWVGRHPRTLLGHSWDGIWYAGIARHGYGLVVPSATSKGVIFKDVAFFPLFPGLTRAVSTVLPVGVVTAGLLVAWLSAGAAAWGVYAVGERLHGRRVGTLLVVVWGLLPHAIVLSMAYTESLMTALAAWSLYATLTGRRLWAGVLGLLAGLSRPNGIAVAAAIACATALALRREPRLWRDWRLWTGLVLAPVGWAGYVVWAGLYAQGSPFGYFEVQRLWGSRFDFGQGAFTFIRHLITGRDVMAYYMSFAVLVVALVALAFLIVERPPAPLLVYTIVLALIAVGGSAYFASKPRFLLPAFPLLLPAALAMARARQRVVVVTIGALAGLSFFYGTYLVAVGRLPM
ncbi:hypothetical protein AB0K09_18335 [Streptomyces sp. NPDC049577]|uniref:hypothetical protein n=1 Tax=Streptomyces sp. NPDC049577 TaxID=3155153 RepID=UPI00341566A9